MHSGMVELEYGKITILVTKSSRGSCLENWENMTCANFPGQKNEIIEIKTFEKTLKLSHLLKIHEKE